MKTLKGFVNIQQFLSNVPGTVSPIGELSAWGLTYSRDWAEYVKASVPGYRLISMRSADTVTGVVALSQELAELTIDVVQSAVAYCTTNSRPYISADFGTRLTASFFNKVTNLSFGKFIDGLTCGLPEWISFNTLDGLNFVKVWLADISFINQYDEYDIVVVPPITPLDSFFGGASQLKALLATRTVPVMMESVQQAKANIPETFIRSLNFNYSNPNNTNDIVQSTWTVLINGVQGDNVDAIKDAITAYVLANSTHTQTEWEVLLPDLFKRTEFVLLPRWDLMSIENLTLRSGLYGSLVSPVEVVQFAKAYIGFYPDDHIANNITLMPFDYKALMIEAVNGPNNVISKATFGQLFKDYVPVSTTSLDFNRMSTYTQEWLILLAGILVAAETADAYSAAPPNARKVYRDSKLYLSFMYDGVNYLVATKQGYGL